MAEQRSKGPSDYPVRLVSEQEMRAASTKATSPWAPLLAKLVESGKAALEVRVSDAREGTRLCSRLRKLFGQLHPGYECTTKTLRIPDDSDEERYLAYLIVTKRPGKKAAGASSRTERASR